MAQIDDRLVPQDGISDFRIQFTRMELVGRGAGRFTFQITAPEHHHVPIEMAVLVQPRRGYGLDDMMVRAHDALIDALRHLLYQVDRLRSHHEKQAAQVSQSANNEKERNA